MNSETVLDLVFRREGELLQRRDELSHELSAIDSELASIVKIREAVEPKLGAAESAAAPEPPSPEPEQPSEPEPEPEPVRHSPYFRMTMKELAVKALWDRFREGATAAEFLEYFRTEWGRTDIKRESLSPQLSRLKREGVLGLNGNKWVLTEMSIQDAARLHRARRKAAS